MGLVGYQKVVINLLGYKVIHMGDEHTLTSAPGVCPRMSPSANGDILVPGPLPFTSVLWRIFSILSTIPLHLSSFYNKTNASLELTGII